MRTLLLLFILFSLTACDSNTTYAPVTDAIARPIHKKPPQHLYKTHPTQLRLQQSQLKPQLKPIPKKPSSTPPLAKKQWQWPAFGPVISNFSSHNKGINIEGRMGTPILAAAAGKVVYSGNGLRAYGNLIIIKHNHLLLTAYAHNNTVLVKEGDRVKMGQKIAEMGSTGTHQTMLHFEVRKNGKPVDPLTYLTQRHAGQRSKINA